MKLSNFVFNLGGGKNSIVIFSDKAVEGGLYYRAAVIPPMVRDQIFAYLQSVIRLRDLCTRRHEQEAARVLGRILAGDAALFAVITSERSEDPRSGQYRIRSMQREHIESEWSELKLPVVLLRARFTQISRRAGATSPDIRRQMGHTSEFVPFGPEDPDSPIDFANRLGPVVQRALRADHWRVLGECNRAARVLQPPAAKSCDAVAKQQATIVGLAGRLEGRYQRQIVDEVDRAEVGKGVVDAIAAVVSGYSHQSVPKDIVVAPDDMLAMQERLDGRFPDPGAQIAARRILRSLIRRYCLKQGWKSLLPRLVFMRDADLPSMTPAVSLAYATILGILRWAEAVLDLELPVGRGKSPSDALLSLAVIELAVRSGITTPERLTRCLQNLAAVREEPDRLDCVLVEFEAETLNSDEDEASGDSGTITVKESVVLSGAAALMALSWRKQRVSAADVTVERIQEAIWRTVPRQFLGTTSAAAALRALLTTAALGRRLTQPGIRGAWEEGTLGSRTLPAARVEALRTNAITHQPVRAELRDVPVAVSSEATTTGGDAEFLRWLRRRIHQQISGKATRLSRSSLAADIEESWTKSTGTSGTSQVLMHHVCGRLKKTEKIVSIKTVYADLTGVVEPLIRALGDRDMLTLSSEDLIASTRAAIAAKNKDNRLRTYWVLRQVLWSVQVCKGVTLDLEDLEGLAFGLPVPAQAAPYLMTEAEYLWIRQRLHGLPTESLARPSLKVRHVQMPRG